MIDCCFPFEHAQHPTISSNWFDQAFSFPKEYLQTCGCSSRKIERLIYRLYHYVEDLFHPTEEQFRRVMHTLLFYANVIAFRCPTTNKNNLWETFFRERSAVTLGMIVQAGRQCIELGFSVTCLLDLMMSYCVLWFRFAISKHKPNDQTFRNDILYCCKLFQETGTSLSMYYHHTKYFEGVCSKEELSDIKHIHKDLVQTLTMYMSEVELAKHEAIMKREPGRGTIYTQKDIKVNNMDDLRRLGVKIPKNATVKVQTIDLTSGNVTMKQLTK